MSIRKLISAKKNDFERDFKEYFRDFIQDQSEVIHLFANLSIPCLLLKL